MTITDRLIAPNATRAEVLIGFAAAFTGAAVALGLTLHARQPVLAVVVVTVVGFDLFGGAVVNATASAKRWYHRPGRTRRHHLAFVAVHIQPFVLALTVPGFPWLAAATMYAIALVAAVAVSVATAELRTPVAFLTAVFGIAAVTNLPAVPTFLAWFAPVLLVKLLLAHLLPETPLAQSTPAAHS